MTNGRAKDYFRHFRLYKNIAISFLLNTLGVIDKDLKFSSLKYIVLFNDHF